VNTPELCAEAALHEVAFGARPGTHPLPAATTAVSRWWRAVALGGQGRYSAADTERAVLLRGAGVAPHLSSLGASTRGSHLRQLGRHGAARPWDAHALVAASSWPQPWGQDEGATLSAELLEQSREHDLLPLRWAAAMLLTALEPGSDAVEAELRAVTALLARRGRVLG